jgi:hypothetical protein
MKFWLKEIVRSGVIAKGWYWYSWLFSQLLVVVIDGVPLGPILPKGKKILVVDDRWMKVSFFFATYLFFLTVGLLIDSVINGSLLRFQNNGDFWQFLAIFDGNNSPKKWLQSISWFVFPIIDYIWILKINHQNVELEKTSF